VKERYGRRRSKEDGKRFISLYSEDDEVEGKGITINNNERRLTLSLVDVCKFVRSKKTNRREVGVCIGHCRDLITIITSNFSYS
jgi:hypothetical protein